MKRILLLPFIFGLLLIPCWGQTKDSQNKLLITIERTPVWLSPGYSAQIYGDGTVIYEGKTGVEVKGIRKYKIPIENVKELAEDFQRINYFSLKDKYQDLIIYDQSSTATSIEIDGKKKKIITFNGGPEELYKLENKIEDFAGVSRFMDLKERFIQFYTALNANPAFSGIVTNYGNAKKVSKRESDIRMFIKFWKFDINRVTFAKRIRKSNLKTEFRITNGEKSIDF
jgi:hypothetical protein